jgi:glutamyl-tRNA reductase
MGLLQTERTEKVIDSIFAIGFNHHNSNASARSLYSLSNEQKETFVKKSSGTSLRSFAILSTCNRTEIYGYGDKKEAQEIYLDIVEGKADHGSMICKQGREAIEHIFKVPAGLDSQVIGDLEILSQFKQAFQSAKKHKMLDGFLERLANNSLQAAKEVRSQTRISSGTVSLSYAATRYIKNRFEGRPCEVLILGAGKFGSRIAKNLHDYCPEAALKICNRTREKAASIVALYGGDVVEFKDLEQAVLAADVVISSVNDVEGYVLNTRNVKPGDRERLFIDMSIPLSIDPEIGLHGNAEIITLDEVSEVINNTLETRKEDIPVAEQIITKHIDEFCSWAEVADKSKSIVEWKKTMRELSTSCPYMNSLGESQKNKMIGRSVANFAAYVKQNTDLPSDTEQIIAHFLKDSEHSVACQQTGFELPPETNCCSCLKK